MRGGLAFGVKRAHQTPQTQRSRLIEQCGRRGLKRLGYLVVYLIGYLIAWLPLPQ